MKKLVTLALASLMAFSVFAGDVATFVDGGFSADGKTYVFGQYGKTDKNFQGWAEIIEVDIAKNDYVDNGVFRIKPTAVTAGKQGAEVYESLEAKSYYALKGLDLVKVNPEQLLYYCEAPEKTGEQEITFKDFKGSTIENPCTYKVKVVPSVSGTGASAKSSFYIDLKKLDANGNEILSKTVGSPSIKRTGVTGYKVEQIFTDKTGKKMIFVVEKTMHDATGVLIRYMVEAVEL
ncbi:MAG: DUF2259 domain-containing protein [Treponema sp.]|nr:DUF2259 domain-containing protein [Treponema sp.]